MPRRQTKVTPELLLRAYQSGYFPMAETRGSAELFWLNPEQRGILPLDAFHLPRRLRRTVLSGHYAVTADTDFAATIDGCAAPRPGHSETWINPEIRRLYLELHRMGCAHSVECRLDGALVGGLYGVAIGGAFFGESMFSVARDASKVALVHLVARLKAGGFRLLDTQFLTGHLTQFGAIEIPRADYQAHLDNALEVAGDWLPDPAGLREAIQALRTGSETTP
ncbi:MAG: leucyl/phenylalanyl-tRNA--protein transferase [Alphaproteobacteria bacterium]|nr:leucyl/phenylalanyl-tRNA--protein transferase [Alphaproteobacteria bacterium]